MNRTIDQPAPTAQRRLRIGLAALNHGVVGYGGGLDQYVRGLVEALADHDPTTDYWVITDHGHIHDWSYRDWPGNLSFHALQPAEPRQPLPVRAWRRGRRALGRSVPAHYGESYWVRQIAALGLDLLHFPDTLIEPLSITVPCLLTVFDIQHEYFPEFFGPAELQRRARYYRPSVEKATHIVVPSRFTAETLSEKYAVPAEKMSYIPVGISGGRSPATADEIARVRAKYRLEDTYVFYPANPWAHKNHARLMAALRLYGNQYGHQPQLVLSGRLLNETRDAGEFALAAGVADRVIDLGYVAASDLPGLYGGAALMVFPSLFEGFGMPLLEAMAFGCPIAAAAATAIPECVGQAADLFDPFEPGAIAAAIHSLISHPLRREELRAKGFERVRDFGWDRIVKQHAEVYRRVVGDPRTHAVDRLPRLPEVVR